MHVTALDLRKALTFKQLYDLLCFTILKCKDYFWSHTEWQRSAQGTEGRIHWRDLHQCIISSLSGKMCYSNWVWQTRTYIYLIKCLALQREMPLSTSGVDMV